MHSVNVGRVSQTFGESTAVIAARTSHADLHPAFTRGFQYSGMEDPLTLSVAQYLQQIMQESGSHDARSRALLRLAGNYRLAVLQPDVATRLGHTVAGGLFAGMRLLPRASEGCMLPKLLGCYEAELQPHLSRLAEAAPDLVLNIGCAEGWYAVGMALLLPDAEVAAFDLDPAARGLCREMAVLNNVSARVAIGDTFRTADFAAYRDRRVLVLCDIEGAERDLLDPLAAPDLRGFDLIVEAHDAREPVAAMLAERFAATHHVVMLQGLHRTIDLPDWMSGWPEIDRLLAVWEMRRASTPWLILQSRRPTK
jgi:hypothetical protein